MNDDKVRLGVIGCGGFGLFALQHFTQIPDVELVGMAGTHREAAYAAARRYGVPDIVDVEKLVAQNDVDVIYISTPPFLHHQQAAAALRHGKHVLVEKPLAMNLQQADEMLALAREKDRFCVANLMQRYNPLYEKIGTLIREKILGELLHAYFENYAADEGLAPEHWFWDPEKSGGIFIEHGVHFFDMFARWLGEGNVVAAQRTIRPTTGVEEQVQCTVRYGPTVLVNYYHGFTQPNRMDRQEMRFLFERGDVTLHEWIPTRVRIHAIADEKGTRDLCELFPGVALDVRQWYHGAERSAKARHQSLDVYQQLDLRYGDETFKMHNYGLILRNLFADQIAWTKDHSRQRKITEENGRTSLATALEATRLARQETPTPNR